MSDILLENSGDNIEQLIEQASNAIPNKDYKVLNQIIQKFTTEIANLTKINKFERNFHFQYPNFQLTINQKPKPMVGIIFSN